MKGAINIFLKPNVIYTINNDKNKSNLVNPDFDSQNESESQSQSLSLSQSLSQSQSESQSESQNDNFQLLHNKTILFIDYEDEIEPQHITEPYLESYLAHNEDFIDPNIKLEPILSTKSSRYTVYPIQYNSIWKNYKGQEKINWVVEEVDLSKDLEHWDKDLSSNDKIFIMHVLAFFAAADGIVNANIKKNLIDVVKIKEAECAYGKQFQMENVHGEMYSLLLDTFIKDDVLRDKLINAIKSMPSIKKKAAWCNKWIDSDKTYAHKLVAFAIVEGIFFSGSFASIFWLKTRPGSVMPGLRKSNKFIAKDENKHVELACLLYKLLNNKLKESVIYEILKEAIDIEIEFINTSLPCKLLGMNADLMAQYIQYCADTLLADLGYNNLYNVSNPFEYMKKIDTFVKDNFFEIRPDEYSDSKIDNPRIFEFAPVF